MTGGVPEEAVEAPSSTTPFTSVETKRREWLKIQNLEAPRGPSPKNSWPRPFPHWEQLTFNAPGFSSLFETLSGLIVLEKAGHGESC